MTAPTLPSPVALIDASPVEAERSDTSVRSLLSEVVGHRYQAVPLRRDNGELIVGMVSPGDLRAVDDLRALLGERFTRVQITEAQLTDLLDERRGLDQEVNNVAQIVAEDSFEDQADLATLRAVVEEAPIVKFVNLIILQAVHERASDIHVEPSENDLRIRFRIDGVLHERMRQPRSIIPGVISRLKVMADIDIAERRVPKDGRISLTVDGAPVDLRVSTLPTVYGE
ncbi:MAG: GspE/PulE family protein, partial [Ilumatobacteraceae bacterium]